MAKSKTTISRTMWGIISPIKPKKQKRRKAMPPIVQAACRTKQIRPIDLHGFKINEVDIILNLKGSGPVRVEISALPAGVVTDHFQPDFA